MIEGHHQLLELFRTHGKRVEEQTRNKSNAHAESHWMSDQRINHYQGMP